MKITKAETILISVPFQLAGTPPWSFGGKIANRFDTLMVRLETDTGIVGWGEAFSRNQDKALKNAIDTRILPLVVGKDAARIAQVKHELEFNLHNFGRVGSIMYGIAAVDIAMWDILGKSCGVPLVMLLGGPFTDRVEAYASLLRYSNEKDVARVTREAIDRGYRYIKLHEIGMKEIRAACEAAGNDARIMLDTNCPWTVTEALACSRELAPLNLRQGHIEHVVQPGGVGPFSDIPGALEEALRLDDADGNVQEGGKRLIALVRINSSTIDRLSERGGHLGRQYRRGD